MKYHSTDELLMAYSRYWKIDFFDMWVATRVLEWDNWPKDRATHAFRDIDYRIFFKRYCKRNIKKGSFAKFKELYLALWHEKKHIEIGVI